MPGNFNANGSDVDTYRYMPMPILPIQWQCMCNLGNMQSWNLESMHLALGTWHHAHHHGQVHASACDICARKIKKGPAVLVLSAATTQTRFGNNNNVFYELIPI